MSTFKELQEEYIKNSKINTLNISKDQRYDYLYPIKIEKVNEEYHLFMMLENNELMKKISLINATNYTIDKLISNNLFINIPLNKFDLNTNTLIFGSAGTYAYIMDGSKLDIDMLNHLRKCNYNSIRHNLEWIDVNEENSNKIEFGIHTNIVKNQIIQQLKEGKIFN
jgi:hypothetical protein